MALALRTVEMHIDFNDQADDAYKVYLKNGRLMAFIAVIIISLHTMIYLLNIFSITPWITDFITKQSYQLLFATPGSPEFTNLVIGTVKDLKIFLVVELVFLLISAIASLFFAISTTYASALIHGGKNISIKDLVSTTIRSLKRPLITCFYITLFLLGYLSLCFTTLLLLAMILGIGGDQITSAFSAILLTVSATVFYTFESVVWNLSLVISVLEEKFGIEALGKAAQICLRLVKLEQPKTMGIVIAVLVVSSIWMVRMFWYTAYTVLYYRCKKTHGEEVELQAADHMEYTRIPSPPLTNETIP
ncbi:uncharacterized protein LOC111284383 [Durio zibethinus]|uniref:Uncharacterized protein LOC111284383 n=1 Tax=Durio zibethinus TaxID=66656 RepID=A0A6P5XKX5_DURZI|nr:uncharacterized protein LOC111284383 [Durio zibethinus]